MTTKNLTDRAVQAATAPQGKRLELWDAKTPGLCLRVSGDSKTWVLRYRTPDGRQPRFTLGAYSRAYGLAEARGDAEEWRVRIRKGADPAGEKRQAKAAALAEPIRTFTDLKDTYFTACETGEWKPRGKRKRASTLGEERGLWRRHVATLGALRVEDVNASAIKRVLRALVAEKKDTTANRVHALVRQILNFAVARQRLQRNPIADVEAMGTETSRDRVLADGELRAVWGALTSPTGRRKPVEGVTDGERVYVSPLLAIAVKVLALTMTRRAEVAGMQVDELDLDHGVWTIGANRTKSGRPHVVPLSPQAVTLIREALRLANEGHEEASPRVFPGQRDRAKSVTPSALSTAMRELAATVGVSNARPHDLRRTGATLMAERLNVSPFIIGQVLAHSAERGGAAAVTSVYNRYGYFAEKRAALSAWGNLVDAIAAAAPPLGNVTPLRVAAP